MWSLGGHLGGLVSALVDGQLDPVHAERSWTHVMGCDSCRAAVQRETWVKNQLASLSSTEPPAGLFEAIDRLARVEQGESEHVTAAWATVGELERRHRLRRVRLVAAGAGSVSAAVIALGAVSGAVDLKEPRPAGAAVGGADRPTLPAAQPVGQRMLRSPTASPLENLLAPSP